ncbi:Hypothetical protein, putative [Bodo saltans]|uniref:Uncharacterized protein n=1 Tax=Bodo saltans TaxID=75058 RepID=A0A0S4IR21_BODSA|nr:Hypothetical protein, putative [Bodo saltans]|eukprot:CUF24377.1 Hypothetical protein, putative [Bodo saltans]
MGGEIADVFVELLDKHAVSLAVILDDDPQSNAFALSSLESSGASPWCSGALASLILSAVGQRTILKGAEVQSPFGFVVAMVLWLRVLAASCKTSAAALIQLPVENLRALPNLVLQALNMLGSQQQRFGSQRWLVLLHQALDLLATLVDKHVIDDALTGNTSVLCDLVTPLLQATIAPPVTAPIANPKKQKPAKSSAVEASPALPLLSVLDNQGVVASLLAVASFWAELPGCGTLLEVFVNNMIPWFCTISPRKELTEALSQFLVRTKLVNHVYLKSMEGQSVVTAIIRASSPSSSLVFAQLVSTVSSSSGKLTAATDALLASVVSATSSTSSQHLRDSFLALHAHHSVAEVIDLVVTFCRKQQNISGDAIISRIDHLAIEHSDFKNVVTGVTNELHAIAQKHAADEQKRQSERVAQASCAAQEENLKRQQQAKELNAMRKQYAAMMARRETLSEVAAQRLAHANVALETRNSSRSRTARENLDALRKAEQQAKKNREEALRASVASYRERIAQTRNVTTFLKTLGLSDARAYAVPRELQSRLLSLSPQEVMEYIVHGDAAMPHDLATAAQRYDEREASERQQITFTDEITTSTGVVANGRNQAPSFWELVMADVEQLSSEGQPSSANTTDTTATKGNSFHFRVAPLLDLFNFDGEPDENEEPKSVPKKSLPVRYVKQYLEEPCGQGERTPNDNSVSTTWASLCGFEDALHMVYVAQLKGLVKLEKGFIALTPLGHAYHEDFWDPERSLAVTLARRREAAQAALQFAATESANVDNFDDLDNEDVNWFDDELL